MTDYLTRKDIFVGCFREAEKNELLVLLIQLPNGAKEIITNYQNIEEKFSYILENYDDNLQLKHNQNVKIWDWIIA